MVSEETAAYIGEHLESCDECKAELENLRGSAEIAVVEEKPDSAKPFKKIMKKMNRQFYSVAYAALIFLIFLGFGWTGGENLMYNSLIMPVAGVFGYYVFRWKAIYKLPILLLAIDLGVFACQIIEIGFADTLIWTLIYSCFALVGVAIAFLLHYAFKKEERK
jgi:hypothetical protein